MGGLVTSVLTGQGTGRASAVQNIGIAVIGAGPYGLSVAAHLRDMGVPFRIFGRPLENWREHMPTEMTLKSRPFATNLSGPRHDGSLANYCDENDIACDGMYTPLTLKLFISYGLAFQRKFVPDIDERQVSSLCRVGKGFELVLDDGQKLSADRVVVATGISYFADLPDELLYLPECSASHSSAHNDLSAFGGMDVTVLGGGASAVDIAIHLHEAGARTSLIARGDTVQFYPVDPPRPRNLLQRITHPRASLGDWLPFWVYEKRPSMFRLVPGRRRVELVRRVLGPASPETVRERFESGVTVAVGEAVVAAQYDHGRVRLTLRGSDGTVREVVTDHVIAATGYRPRIASIGFLSSHLRESIRTFGEMPLLSAHFESSVPGLYFVGLAAAGSFGPLMRFVAGAEYAAPRLARELARRTRRRTRSAVSEPVAIGRSGVGSVQ